MFKPDVPAGAEIFSGDQSQNLLIVKNRVQSIEFSPGMLESNILTLILDGTKVAITWSICRFRELYKKYKSNRVETACESITYETGRSSFLGIDPNGNLILIEQQV